MEERIPVPQNNSAEATVAPMSAPAQAVPVCPQCHLPVRPEYYFCPNCGQKLSVPPLSTSVGAQILLYLFSAVLPWIAYLAITKWEGIKYMRSPNPQARTIGWIALAILIVSSIIAFWLTISWIDQSVNSAMTDVGNINGFSSGL
jgi:hypothetical protein